MFLNNDKYQWETREDAMAIQKYQSILKDPKRLAMAQECITESVVDGINALGGNVQSPMGKTRNPATIKKL